MTHHDNVPHTEETAAEVAVMMWIAKLATERAKLKKRKKMKYNITSQEVLDALALQKHPIELDESGNDKNNLLRQVFINGYLLGMKAIIEANQQNQKR
jgi:hypothetical protein